MARFVVKLDFPLLKLALSWIQADLVQSLDGIRGIGVNIDGCVNHTVGSNTKDAGKFKPVGKNESKPVFWGTYSTQWGGWRWGRQHRRLFLLGLTGGHYPVGGLS